MSSLVSIRFPDGTVELRPSAAAPRPGDSLTAFGRKWIVQAVDGGTMTCPVVPAEPASDEHADPDPAPA